MLNVTAKKYARNLRVTCAQPCALLPHTPYSVTRIDPRTSPQPPGRIIFGAPYPKEMIPPG
jgi:hypothetical protein